MLVTFVLFPVVLRGTEKMFSAAARSRQLMRGTKEAVREVSAGFCSDV